MRHAAEADSTAPYLVCTAEHPCQRELHPRYSLRIWQRMRVIRWKKKLVLVGVALTILILLYVSHKVQSTFKDMRCSDKITKKMIQDLCKEYNNGEVAGNLCDALCTTKDIQIINCLNYRDGKKILKARWLDRTIILKSKNAFMKDYDSIGFVGSHGLELPSLKDFVGMVRDSVAFNLAFVPPEDNNQLLSHLWSLDFEKFLRVQDRHYKDAFYVALRSLWSLTQQDEYLLMKYFQKSKHFPTIYGTCGHVYATEYAPSGKILSPGVMELAGLKGDMSSWTDRVNIALGLLDLLQTFQDDYNETLNFCDMKGDNFGRVYYGEKPLLKAIDVDMAIFMSKLRMDLSSPVNCTKHSDCNFFDCWGWCHMESGLCSDRRTNTNLQALCNKIFLNEISNVYRGLLQYPPPVVQHRVLQTLQLCRDKLVSHGPHDVDLNEERHMFQRIYSVLENTLYYPSERKSHKFSVSNTAALFIIRPTKLLVGIYVIWSTFVV